MADITWGELVKLAAKKAPDEVMRIRAGIVLSASQTIVERDATIKRQSRLITERDATIKKLEHDKEPDR